MVVEIRKRSDGINLKIRDQSCFRRIAFRDEHPLESIGACNCGHRQNSARVTDDAVKREFANDKRALHGFRLEAAGKDDHAKRDGQVIGRTFLADGGRRKIDNDSMTGKMQTGILDRSLHALAAFLHGGIGQADDDDGGQAVGIIHFDFHDDAFESDHGAREYAGKHGGSVDEEEGNVK